MPGCDIFISYCRDDEGVARRFAEAFAHEGFNVWWDAALHSGETFDEVIEKELRTAKAVVVLWSPRSVGSRWVRAEATLADRNKTLAPVIIEPCDRPIIFELTHTVDLSHWHGDMQDGVWRVFVHDVRRLINSGAADGEHASSVARSLSRERPRAPSPAMSPQQQAGLAAGNALAGARMDDLMSALSTLQEAILKQGGTGTEAPQPVPAQSFEDDEATQFFTAGTQFDLIEGDEFHCLEISDGGAVEQRFVVGPLGIKVGRTAPADVILPDSKVSRSHCRVELKDGQLFVSDLKSTNGTFVDGQRVTGAAILPVGSVLRVGHFALVHELRSRAEVA